MPAMTFTTRLLAAVPRVEDIRSFRFERPASYEYRAGQWGAITIQRGAERVDHHFTHSSSPSEDFLELTTHVRDTPFKRALAALSPGDEVEMQGPYGSFVLDGSTEPAVFLTGGIGVTPVRSILRHAADSGSTRPFALLLANRRSSAIPFRAELAELSDRMMSLLVVHVISEPDPGWTGARGHIDEALLRRTLGDLHSQRFYLCGPPGMVAAMAELLRGAGVLPEQVVAERFDGYENLNLEGMV